MKTTKNPNVAKLSPLPRLSERFSPFETVSTSTTAPASVGRRSLGFAAAALLVFTALAVLPVPTVAQDTTPPVFLSAEVLGGGDVIDIRYNEDLDRTETNFPHTDAFTLIVDGAETLVGSVALPPPSFPKAFLLIPRNRIYRNQTVTLSYADPTTGNDARATQDLAGNDGGSFDDQVVINNSTRMPVQLDLSAYPTGPTSIGLEWDISEGAEIEEITGYRIEYSDDGQMSWNELIDYTGDRTDLQYTVHRGLNPDTLYYYRILTIIGRFTEPPSEVVGVSTESQPQVIDGLSYTAVLSGSSGAGANLCWTPEGVALSQFREFEYGYMYFELDENSAMPWEDDGTFHFIDLRRTEPCNADAGVGIYQSYLSGQEYFVKFRAMRNGQRVESNRVKVQVFNPNTRLKARIMAEGFYGIGPDGQPVFPDVPGTVDSAFEIGVGFGYQFPGDAATAEVTGFEISDLEATNATLSAPTGGLKYETFIGYRVVVTPTTLGHDVTVKVKANAVTGKGTTKQNRASNTFRRRTAN